MEWRRAGVQAAFDFEGPRSLHWRPREEIRWPRRKREAAVHETIAGKLSVLGGGRAARLENALQRDARVCDGDAELLGSSSED